MFFQETNYLFIFKGVLQLYANQFEQEAEMELHHENNIKPLLCTL